MRPGNELIRGPSDRDEIVISDDAHKTLPLDLAALEAKNTIN